MNETAAPPARNADTRVFSTSMVISGVRCALAYVILPFLAPLAGISSGVGPWIGLPLGIVAICANILSIRRFWNSNHRWKWPMSVINLSVIALLAVLVAIDISDVLT
ncbi:MAG: hypothetical protein VYE75_10310 [Actinomycetota bacterium]|jgi:hypothetical protein|nr:hypothetical protein [Acidimicrobiales bacterium]MEC8977102.1 hypothetical protein [Actinomycetota bacterium]MED5174025.1 hypothetical protein [Actinomycetota bacterium]|tara:strand:- start:1852 stop:2172 length:321 start_codon:yes stop_codon:yes gene_type:complete